jgi:hypothetical protein
LHVPGEWRCEHLVAELERDGQLDTETEAGEPDERADAFAMDVLDELEVLFARGDASECPDEQSHREQFVICWDPQDKFVEKVHAVNTKTDKAVEEELIVSCKGGKDAPVVAGPDVGAEFINEGNEFV